MGVTDAGVASPSFKIERGATAAGAVHAVTLEFFAVTDPGEIAGAALAAAGRVVASNSASLWVPDGDVFECRGAVGDGRELLLGTRAPAAVLSRPIGGEDGVAVLAPAIAVNGHLTALLRISRALDHGGPFSAAEQEALQQLTDGAGAAMANAARLAAARRQTADRERDLALITEMSREITSTLDLDRVLRSVVNLASRAFRFDRGAIALYERGACDIRAVAGAQAVDADDPGLKDLAVRAAWAAGVGEAFYLSDRDDPASDAERTFAQIFGADLERDGAMSALYLPLKDEEGILGILLFEAERTEFANMHERDLAASLANQATVAVRNARLYHQVPLADTLGALSARKEAFLALPKHRRVAIAGTVALLVGAVTLIRWPLRVVGAAPVFRPLAVADVRPNVSGVIDRVFIREGMRVERGTPVVHLRDDELRANRDGSVAAVAEAEREAAIAAAHGDAAEERLQRRRADVLRRDVTLADEQLGATTGRSPVAGVVLTPRPEERIGSSVAAGEAVTVIGRTDSLELDFGVEEQEITGVHSGDEVRLRIAALPQRTFTGRVVWIGPVPTDTGAVLFPVRAVVANADGLLRPGMSAYTRVLTEPASPLWRVLRGPARSLRLLWWRIWS